MQIPEGPFAVRVVAYFLAGFGIAIQVHGLLVFFVSPIETDMISERWHEWLRWESEEEHCQEARASAWIVWSALAILLSFFFF